MKSSLDEVLYPIDFVKLTAKENERMKYLTGNPIEDLYADYLSGAKLRKSLALCRKDFIGDITEEYGLEATKEGSFK